MGGFSVDRFYLGYTALGVLKLLTAGGVGIWALIDFIRIGVDSLRPADGSPWVEKTRDENIRSIAANMQAIAEKLGMELEVTDIAFDSIIPGVQTGKYDMGMAGMTVTDERKEQVNFSDSYATGVQVVIVKEGSDVTLDNLGEKMIGTQRGTTGYIYTSDDYGDDHVTAYDNGASAVQALINGQVDCVVIDSAPAEAFVAANAGLTILDTEYVTESYAIGVNKDNTALLDAINQALAELTADGTVQSIVDKYISAE